MPTCGSSSSRGWRPDPRLDRRSTSSVSSIATPVSTRFVCEVKYAEAMGREVIAQVDQKAARIVEELKPYAVHKVLITVFPPAPAIVRSGCFDDILTFESLF